MTGIAKVFQSGLSQAVRIPKEYRFDKKELIINRIGNTTLLTDKTDPWASLNEVSIGGIRRRDVRATITSGEFNGVLLGMSFLRHYSLRQQDGKLVISEGLDAEQMSINQ